MAISYYHSDGTVRYVNAKVLNNLSAMAIISAAYGRNMASCTQAYSMTVIEGIQYVNIFMQGLPYEDLRQTAVCFAFAGNVCRWEGGGRNRLLHIKDPEECSGYIIAECCVTVGDHDCISVHPWCMHRPDSLRRRWQNKPR